MQKNIVTTIIIILSFSSLTLNAQYTEAETQTKRCFIGTSSFVIMNLDSEERPDFAQLNIGYRITAKDAISLELKTWRYFEPIGIPFGKSKSDPNENFPGFIREKGFAVAYQRFFWKGLYAGIHIMNAWQDFVNKKDQKIDNGFQIFNTYRIGYHVKLFKGNFFIEPSLAITHRPYHTEMPTEFKERDDKWSKFFFGEPGLHIGFNF